MRILSTIIVLIVAAAGVLAMARFGWDQQQPGSTWRAGDGAPRKLLTDAQLPIDDLTRIALKRAGESSLVFERKVPSAETSVGWVQVQPFVHPMEHFSIRQLAQQAMELDVIDVLDAAVMSGSFSSETLGLNPPTAEITYDWPGGSLALHLGRRSVAGRAYAKIKGEDRVYIVNQRLHERVIETDPKEWRSRVIFDEVGANATRIEWNNGPAKLVLERDRRQWMMLAPARTRVDQAIREQYADAVGRAIVSGFILDQPTEGDLAKFGLVESPVHLTVTDGAGTQRLIIGSRAGGGTQDFFALIEGRPTVVRISGAVLAALFRQPHELAAHTASGVNPADVKTIVIRAGDEELKLERDLDRWFALAQTGPVAPAPPDSSANVENGEGAQERRAVNSAHVQELLEQLTQLRALGVEFVERFPHDLLKATVTLFGYDGRALDTVRIIHEPQTGRWGMENGDNVMRVHPAGLRLRLTAPEFGLR